MKTPARGGCHPRDAGASRGRAEQPAVHHSRLTPGSVATSCPSMYSAPSGAPAWA